MSRIVVLAGEGEYESDRTMRPIAVRMAEAIGSELVYRVPDVLDDVPFFPESRFGSLDELNGADLLVLYTRFRVLPDDELAAIASFVDSGGNILALRTATHAFHPMENSIWFDWTSSFASRVLGSGWSRHHGHTSTTVVSKANDRVVVDDLPERFSVASWLYVNQAPADATILLNGEPVNPETEAEPSPVAWTRELGTQRIFYTSLGSQRDLEQTEVVTLLVNAAVWCSSGSRR